MKVLITGGAGYIGDGAVVRLLSHGHEVTVYDNLTYGGAYMRRHTNLSFIRADIRDADVLYEQIDKHDAVLHLAALVGDGACAIDKHKTVEVNETATARIARRCRDGDKRLVFASTCSVYGANNELLSEDSPTNPLSAYAGTKLKAEEFVREVPRHFIFRLGTLFGLGAEHARLRCDLVVNILTYKACSGQPITVFGGEQWRPLLHVRDAGDLMAWAAVRPVRSEDYGTYVLNDENYKIIDVAKTIMDICRLPANSLRVTDMRFEDLRNYRVESQRNNIFAPIRSLHDGIREMAKIIREGRIADIWDAHFHNARYAMEKS